MTAAEIAEKRVTGNRPLVLTLYIEMEDTVLLNSDHQKKKLLHPKSIPTSQCYNCTLIFNNFEMFRMKIFELKPQTGGVNA